MREAGREQIVTQEGLQLNRVLVFQHYSPIKTSMEQNTYASTFDLGNHLLQT